VEYMALIYADESGWESLGADERRAWYDRYRSFSEDARAAGVFVGGDELGSEQVAVTDGPYAEVKEALGGYYLLDCSSIDDAVEWAARIPGAEHGAVEVRAVHVDEEA
jgi:hypothetical protein